MLRSLNDIYGYELQAQDGEIGKAKDFYFNDEQWIVRYLVADTGNWLSDKKVLIATAVFSGEPNWKRRLFPINLTKNMIENCPDINSRKPVSRQNEIDLANFYQWPVYWPIEPYDYYLPQFSEFNYPSSEADKNEYDTHLRSTKEVVGYSIQATDGSIGHVDNFIIDDESWEIKYLVVATRNWLPGRKVLISPQWIKKVRWSEKNVYVDLKKNEIKDSPQYDPNQAVNSKYEEKLFDYYGRPKLSRQRQTIQEKKWDVEIKDVISQDLEITDPNATMEEVSKRLEVGNVGILPVLENSKLVGVVTDRDIVVRGIAQGKDPKNTPIKDVMTKMTVTCSINEKLAEAGRLMSEKKVRRLMVTDDSGNFMGVLSLGDLANKAPDQRFVGEVLEKVSS